MSELAAIRSRSEHLGDELPHGGLRTFVPSSRKRQRKGGMSAPVTAFTPPPSPQSHDDEI